MGRLLSFLFILFFIIFSIPNRSAAFQYEDINKILQEPCRDYDCIYLKQNIKRDSKKCQPTADVAFSDPNIRGTKKISGNIYYEGVWPARYSYSVDSAENNGYEIIVKVHFKNQNEFSRVELEYLQSDLNAAAYIWDEKVPNGIFKFKFLIVKDARQANFSVLLSRKDTRGPYYSTWSTVWTTTMYAHEIGHMMGLDDEYGTILSHYKCNMRSIMCHSSAGSPREYQYYQILKRIHCT